MGKRGAIQRTIDGGAAWEKCALGVEPAKSHDVLGSGTDPANTDIVVANSPIVLVTAFPRNTNLWNFVDPPAALNKFPDPIEKFPDTRFKIPCYR